MPFISTDVSRTRTQAYIAQILHIAHEIAHDIDHLDDSFLPPPSLDPTRCLRSLWTPYVSKAFLIQHHVPSRPSGVCGTGLLGPRMFWPIGSNILIVLESGPILTTQTNVRPTHIPDLKNEVCGAIRLVRFSPASGSIASSASSGNVITWPSDKGSR